MSTKILIGNLPAGTSVEEVKATLVERGWPLLQLERVEEGSPDRVAFTAEVDIDHKTAKMMADRAHDHYFKGRKVTIHVPMQGN